MTQRQTITFALTCAAMLAVLVLTRNAVARPLFALAFVLSLLPWGIRLVLQQDRKDRREESQDGDDHGEFGSGRDPLT